MKRIFLLIGYLLCLALPALAQEGTILEFAAWNATSPGITSITIDGSTDHVEEVFPAKRSGVLASLCTHIVSETGTTATVKVGWEGVNLSNGEADQVYKTGTGECSCTIAVNGLTGWQCCTPTGTTCTVTRGEWGALTTRASTGVDGSNFAVIGATAAAAFNDSSGLIPNNAYAVTNVSGSGAQGAGTKSAEAPIYMYKFTGGVTMGRPYTGGTTQNYNSDSAADEWGNQFNWDCPAGMTYTVKGLRFLGQTASTGKSVTARLYTGTLAVPGTAAQEVDWDADVEASSAGSNRGFFIPFDEASLTELDCATNYLVALEVNETSSNFGLRYFNVGANSDLGAYLPGGANTYAISRADLTGAFTATDTRRMAIDLVLEDLQDPAGGGGGGGGEVILIQGAPIWVSETVAARRRQTFYMVDVTDGETEETGLTISGSECQISKAGGAFANCAGTIAEIANGVYSYELSAAEHNTVGTTFIRINEAAAKKTLIQFPVVANDPYTLGVTVAAVNSNAIEEQDFAARNTAQSVTANTIRLAAAENFSGKNLVDHTSVHIVSATTGAAQTRCIVGWTSATDIATVYPGWSPALTGTVTYNLIPTPNCNVLKWPVAR